MHLGDFFHRAAQHTIGYPKKPRIRLALDRDFTSGKAGAKQLSGLEPLLILCRLGSPHDSLSQIRHDYCWSGGLELVIYGGMCHDLFALLLT